MISKKHFIDVMNQLEGLRIKQDSLDIALRDLCGSGFGSFYLSDYQNIIIDILTENFKDESHWLEYFCYENDWLAGYKQEKITMEDGSHPKIENWGDVYDFLTDTNTLNEIPCDAYHFNAYTGMGCCWATAERDWCNCEGRKKLCELKKVTNVW